MFVGVVRHWRWLFWFLLVAFGFSILVIPTTILQLMGRIPDSFPAWASLSRMDVALVEVGLVVWMVQIYRHHGGWATGRKASGHTESVQEPTKLFSALLEVG